MSEHRHAQALNPSAKLVLAAHSSFMPVMLGTRLFVTSFILSVTADIMALGIFRLAMFVAVWFVFVAIAPICKTRGYLYFYRGGFALSLIFFVAIAYLGDKSSAYLIPAGILLGLACGFYWLPYHLYKMALSQRQSRLTYFAYESALFQIISMAAPVILGWLIWETRSYLGFFALCAALLFVGFSLSRRFRMAPRHKPAPYDLRGFIACVRNSPDLKNVYRATYFMGMGLYGAFDLLIPTLIFLSTGSELQLGLVSSALPILSAATSMAMKKVSSQRYRQVGLIAALTLFAATGVLVFQLNYLGIIIYSAVYAICTQPLGILHVLYAHNVIDKNAEFSRFIPEHFVASESALTLGRLTGFTLYFFLPGLAIDTLAMKIVFLLLAGSSVASVYFLTKAKID